jgi:UDP-glucose 4-epimerase
MLQHHHSTPLKPKRVVILGAAGFVASSLARHLARQGIRALAVGSSQVDLLQPESTEKLAGLIEPEDALVFTSTLTPDKGKDARTFMKNLTMGSHVCAALEKARCAHLVYVSSDSVYDDSATLVSETTPRSPGTFHGVMHLAREQMLQSVLGKPPIPCCVVRPGLIYGAGDTHNGYGPNRFLRTALKDGKITLFGQGEERRDHVYVKDVAAFIEACLCRRTEGAVNIVSGKALSFYDVAQTIRELSGSLVRVECLPRATPITHRHFDVSLRLREFPEFHTTPLEAGLGETLRELRTKEG